MNESEDFNFREVFKPISLSNRYSMSEYFFELTLENISKIRI